MVPEGRILALGAAGACIGFLFFNRPPATIFLGDAGSHLLGFLLAAVGILHFRNAPAWTSFVAACLVVAVPLFEFAFLFVIRVRKGIPWWRGSPDHFALRLQARGFSRLGADLIAWTAALILASVATRFGSWSIEGRLAILPVVLAGAVISAHKLRSWEVAPPGSRPPAVSRATPQAANGIGQAAAISSRHRTQGRICAALMAILRSIRTHRP